MTPTNNDNVPESAETQPAPAAQIQISRVRLAFLLIPVRGTSPLIVCRFPEKAKRAILAKQQGKTAKEKEARDPEADFQASRYRFLDGGDGFPAVAFKAATVGAARFYPKVTMTEIKQMMFFHGEWGVDGQQLARIEAAEPKMREDYVRISMSTTDLRYRAEFHDWRTVLHVQYVESVLSQDTVLALVEAGGLGGIGEWRPSSPRSATGEFGRYEIDPDRKIKVGGF